MLNVTDLLELNAADVMLNEEEVPTANDKNGKEHVLVSTLHIVALTKKLNEHDPSVAVKQHKNVIRDLKDELEIIRNLKGGGAAKEDGSNLSRPKPHEFNHCYFAFTEKKYTNSQNKEQPHYWLTPDLALALVARYSTLIRLKMINALHRAEEIIALELGGTAPSATAESFIPGTEEEKAYSADYGDLYASMTEGYFKLGAVVEEWLSIEDTDDVPAFYELFPLDDTRSKLQGASSVLGREIKGTLSDAGGRAPLYHYDVLNSVFGETVDLSNLRRKMIK